MNRESFYRKSTIQETCDRTCIVIFLNVENVDASHLESVFPSDSVDLATFISTQEYQYRIVDTIYNR